MHRSPRQRMASNSELTAAVGCVVLQPRLGAARVVGGEPGHPDVAAEVDVFVFVDVPAVDRPALGDGAIRELWIFLQRQQRRPDGGGADRGGRAADQVTSRV